MKRIALAWAIALLPTVAFAGTTGSLSGTILNAEGGAPIADARVVATSGAQVEATRTDAHGNFSFISLAPDIYNVTAERKGFEPAAIADVPVFADASLHIPIKLSPALTILVMVDHTSAALVKPGKSSDVYSYSISWISLFPPVQGNYWALRLTPGITFGTGAAVMH